MQNYLLLDSLFDEIICKTRCEMIQFLVCYEFIVVNDGHFIGNPCSISLEMLDYGAIPSSDESNY
jgi:hypothetical protein